MQKAIKTKAKARLYPFLIFQKMHQYVVYGKQPTKSIEASSDHQETPIKDQIIEKLRTRILIPSLFFQDFRAEKFLKT